ncbi:MAG: hypothetical protein H6618_07975 [Deltaproteobacteria bacterium]|nr:hypothetical protein [Deltaproteobacteria bacterium]
MEQGHFSSLIPPAIVLCLGFYTRRVFVSLLVGILSAAFIATEFNLAEGGALMARSILESTGLPMLLSPKTFSEGSNAFICLFLIILGVIISMIHRSGGAMAYESFIRSRFRTARKVESSSLLMSFFLCIDDYFSSLTVGSVMHPVTDSYKIPRAKLAFLIDAMAAPLAILCPVSSWVAAIVGFLKDNGVHNHPVSNTQVLASPFLTYLHVIPYIFYSFIIVATAWFIVLRRVSFGLMGQHEAYAWKTGNVFNGGKPPESNLRKASGDASSHSLFDFFIPVLALIVFVLSGILHSGGWALLPGGDRPFMEAMREASAATGLLTGSLMSLCFCVLFYLGRSKINLNQLSAICTEGLRLMAPSCLILILSWSLGGLMREYLHSGQYLASILTGHFPPTLIPATIFIASTIISFSLGSAWGTAAIMFPIGIQLVLTMADASLPVTTDQIPLLFPALGAILSGCVAGDHISPISDTTIMSSTSTAMEHIAHVETQMTYAIPAIIITAIAFVLSGFSSTLEEPLPAILGLSLGVALVIAIFNFLHRKALKKDINADSHAGKESYCADEIPTLLSYPEPSSDSPGTIRHHKN